VNNVNVSVIMPVYNSGSFLSTAVDSILRQSLKELELILVDDGSTDGSSERCDNYAHKDARVKVIHQKNGGICNARNVAIKIACGEYIAFSDHDDEYLPGLLNENYDLAQRTNADFVKFLKKEIILVHEKTIKTKTKEMKESLSLNRIGIIDSFWKMEENELLNCVWDGLYKRAFIVQYGICFDPFYKNGGEDIDFMLKCVSSAQHIEINNKPFYNHNIRKGFSTSAKFNEYKLVHVQSFPEKINNCLRKLDLPADKYRTEYANFYISNIIGSILGILSSPQCNWTKNRKIELIANLRDSQYCYNWIFNVNTFCILKKEKRYGLLFFLYKYKFYTLCLKLYNIKKTL